MYMPRLFTRVAIPNLPLDRKHKVVVSMLRHEILFILSHPRDDVALPEILDTGPNNVLWCLLVAKLMCFYWRV